MVQPLIAFSCSTPEELYALVKGLRNAGVMKFQNDGLVLDLVPGAEAETQLDPDTEQKRQQIRDAFKTAQQLEDEAREDLEWSMP